MVAGAAAALRWLRVAQREHYAPGRVVRFAGRWWADRALNAVALAGGVAAVAASGFAPLAGLVAAAVGAGAPVGLGVRGRTGGLAWTRRLTTLAGATGFLGACAVAGGAIAGQPVVGAAAVVLGMPFLVDAAAWCVVPVEARAAAGFLRSASRRLAQVHPEVVAVTGSYGKTSTKLFIAHLASSTRSLVASPASFNNLMGLARTINEGLAAGTDVLVVEMGTYAPGEIARLCRLVPPRISVITAIGPVHLERFRSEERIVAAKSEITDGAEVVVLNVDNPHLAALADRLAARPRPPRIVRCSAAPASAGGRGADVHAALDGETLVVRRTGEVLARVVGVKAPATNVACAVAVALELGVPPGEIERRLASLPSAAHRLEIVRAASGVVVVDDTYNANPAGARAALAALAGVDPEGPGRRVVVTPGMVELGGRQFAENEAFARDALAAADTLVVVGRTNRRALTAGARHRAGEAGAGGTVVLVPDRPRAVDWVRRNLGPGDAVLYENDLPDHYP